MKKFFKFYLTRVILTGLLAALQLTMIIGCVCCAFYCAAAFRIILLAAAALTALKISARTEFSPCKTGWTMGILALPAIFLPLYFFFGRGASMKKIRRFAQEHPLDIPDVSPDLSGLPENIAPQFRALESKGGFRSYDGTRCEYLSDGKYIFEKIKQTLENAEHFIFMEFYILNFGSMWDQILEILSRKAESGVKVYILIDDLGTICLLPEKFPRKLERLGIRCRRHNVFSPKLTSTINYRDHRKLVAADGRYAVICGANIADEYINLISPYGYWKDTGVYLDGAAAESFCAMFSQMWKLNGGEMPLNDTDLPVPHEHRNCGICLPFGDIPDQDRGCTETAFLNMINSAVKSVYITTPYLIPDCELTSALCRAAERGTDVRIITPLIPDKRYVHIMTRSSYVPLLRSGVRIYEYVPGFIHAKSMLCDGSLAYVGSANTDLRSMYLHFENGVLMYKCPACKQLEKDLSELFEISREVSLSDRIVISAQKSLLGKLLRLAAPLL